MQRLVAIAVAAALTVPAGARTPDLPGLPVCQDAQGRIVELQDQTASGDWVLFWTESDRDPLGEMVLASCDSGRALRVRLGQSEDSLSSAAAIMRDAMLGTAPRTLTEIQADLRAKGYRASRGSLPSTHCACDLVLQG